VSYLDIPRLHFAGLFFAAPSTINNITTNYNPAVQLEKPGGEFQPNVAGWNALGVAQFYLQQCTVLGAVDSNGRWIGAGADPLIGSPIITPAPLTPMSDGAAGVFDIPKLVDLDPDQQGRTELYGVRFQVRLPSGAMFGGAMSIPQLRELGPRIALTKVRGSYVAVGQFMGAIAQPQWPGGNSGSTLLQQFQQACSQGIAVELTVDMHWNLPQISQNGLMFCFGRVHGTMGPLRAGETGQTLYGRRIPAPATSGATLKMAPATSKVVPAAAAPAPPWNTSYAALSPANAPTVLSIDLGMAIPLAIQSDSMPPAVNGKPAVETGIVVGSVDSNGTFTPLQNGAVSFANNYFQIQSMEKNCYCWTNSGVFAIPLAPSEAARLQTQALAIQANGTTVLQEMSSGVWVQFSQLSGRMPLPGASVSIPMLVTERGSPFKGYTPSGLDMLALEWPPKANQPVPSPSKDLTIALNPSQTDSSGATTMTLKTAVQQMNLSAVRAELESRVYVISPSDTSVDCADGSFPVSLLVWQPFNAPANPAWATDIQPILGAYARLYPGMKERVDIGAIAAAQANASAIAARMALPLSHPAYMPVTRDLAPGKVKMISDFMQKWAKSGAIAT